MDKCFEKAKKIVEKDGETKVFFMTPVQKQEIRLWKNSRLAIVTQTHLILATPGGDLIKEKFCFFDLNLFVIDEKEGYLQLKFENKEFKITSPKLFDLISSIADTIQRILSKSELQDMKFPFSYIGFKTSPNYISIMARFNYHLKKLKLNPSKEAIEYFQNILTSEKKVISLNEFPDTAQMSLLLFSCLPIMYFVESLIVQSITGLEDVTPLLVELVNGSSYVKHLHIDTDLGGKFFRFFNALRKSQRVTLMGITFSNCQLEIDHLKSLSEAAAKSEITSIGIHDAISQTARIFFYTSFIAAEFSWKLRYLDLSHTKFIDVRTLFPKIRNITVLSMESCGIEISEILAAFSIAPMTNLAILNLSGNPFSTPLSTSPSLPLSVQSLVMNNVAFPDGHLLGLLSFIFSRLSNGLKLSFANAIVSTNEWLRVFNYLKTSTFTNVNALTWDSNPVHQYLFDFMSKNRDLEFLSMNGCFFESNQQMISALADYLEDSSGLKVISLRGNRTAYLGKFTIAVITALQNAQSLERLDIAFNNGGDDELLCLKLMVHKLHSLNYLSFDGAKSTTGTSLTELLNVCADKRGRVDFVYPANEVMFLQKNLIYNEDKVKSIREICLRPLPEKDPGKKTFTRPENNFFDIPCNITHDQYTANFISYLSNKDMRNLGREIKTNDETGPSTIVPDIYVEDNSANYKPDNNSTISSLNFVRSKVSTPPHGSPTAPLRPITNSDVESIGRKKLLASALRRAKSNKSEVCNLDFNASLRSKQFEVMSIKSGFSNASPDGQNVIVTSSRNTRLKNVNRVISPFHQTLTADNVMRHSWEFPGTIEIHFDDTIWKEATSEFSIKQLYDEIRAEKGCSPMRYSVKSNQ